MIIDKGVSAGEVITLKLTSGEEIVARLDEETATHYKLTKPQVIGMGPSGPGLMPYLFTVAQNKTIPLSKSTVTVAVASDKIFADQYLQSTTDIQLV
jgi:uncharacterized alpha/beta hydrolase family protein